MRRVIGIGVFAIVLAASGGRAGAATFYVDDSASSPLNPCTSPAPANACTTITSAVNEARLVAGPNTILVAAGTYNEQVQLTNAADDGLTIQGAGTGSTFVDLPTPAGTEGIGSNRPNVTVRNLTVEIPAGATAPTKDALGMIGNGDAIDGVQVLMTGGDSNDVAIRTDAPSGGATTVNRVTVNDGGNASWTGIALQDVGTAAGLTVTDSQFSSNGVALQTSAGSTLIQRSGLSSSGPATAGPDVVDVISPGPLVGSEEAASLTLESSLVLGGTAGVVAKNAFNDPPHHQTASATVRNSTIDPGLPKAADGIYGVEAFDNVGSPSTATVTVDSSIIVGAPQQASNAAGNSSSVTCTNSDVNNEVVAATSTQGAISCGTAAGNPAGNSTNSPSALFATTGLFGGILNFHLADGSPAIDTGSTAPLAAGESATDLDGNPRVLNGDGICPAVRDKGAYEHATVGSDCSPPASGGTTAPPASAPTTNVAPHCKKKKRKHHAAAAKCKKRKKRR